MQYPEGTSDSHDFDDAATGEYVQVSEDDQAPEDDQEEPEPKYLFDELCLPYYGEMTRYARRLSGDNATAADIVQIAMMKAMLAWGSWDPVNPDDLGHSVRAWLYRIVANTHAKHYHYQRVRQRAAGSFRQDLLQASYGTQFEHQDPRDTIDSPLGDEVANAFDRLSPDHRAVIDAHYLDGMNCEQISRHLRIPKNTVFTRLKRARTQLERRLGPYAREAYNMRKEPTPPSQTAPSVRRRKKSVRAQQSTKGVESDAGAVDGVMARDDAPTLLDA